MLISIKKNEKYQVRERIKDKTCINELNSAEVMILLPESPTLSDLQLHIQRIGEERGWNKNNVFEIFLLFAEEVGELAKALRNRAGLYAEDKKTANPHELDEEFADVLNYLLDLANCTGVDLEKAFRLKDAKNSTRSWIEKSKSE